NADTCTAKHVWPGREVGEQTTQMKGFARTANPTSEIAAKVRERIDVFYKVLQQEDYWVCGQAWENIRTGLVPELLYGRNEPALTWLHRSLDQAMEGFSRAETARVR
ncbi:MAG TPA: SRPBCC family protein, partial [Novosphingobium sp.]|nr:SRPBCC family protein [Novosphingobium sp.]